MQPPVELEEKTNDGVTEAQQPIAIASSNRYELLTDESEQEDPNEKVVIGTKRPAPRGKIVSRFPFAYRE